MAKQELIEVGYYLGKTPRERIDYRIDNYSRMEEILEAYSSKKSPVSYASASASISSCPGNVLKYSKKSFCV